MRVPVERNERGLEPRGEEQVGVEVRGSGGADPRRPGG